MKMCTSSTYVHNSIVVRTKILVCLGDFGQIPGPSSVLQGRRARRGDLVTRITVTLPIFIFSTRFLVQNCSE
jgi:hypothetical protein